MSLRAIFAKQSHDYEEIASSPERLLAMTFSYLHTKTPGGVAEGLFLKIQRVGVHRYCIRWMMFEEGIENGLL
jgi:hypothetical protein